MTRKHAVLFAALWGVCGIALAASAADAPKAALPPVPRPSVNAPTGDVPTPAEERADFTVADGFEVTLFAADPQLAKPIQMNFDPQGRLWVVSSALYPQIAPGQAADDKVLILEDTANAGKADKITVFAGGLLIPTGVEPGDGGCYVSNSTELVHFSNPGPDGKARDRRVVLSGFGTEDTHHILHTLRWGPDSRLYMNQSVYIHSHIETPFGPVRLLGGGIWRFDPRTERLEVFIKGMWNTWGHHFDYWGQDFATDGAGTEGINYNFPNAVYPASPGADRTFHGLNPGSPKYAGLEIVSGRHLPDDWQGNLITGDFRASRLCRFVVSDDGSGFSAKQLPDLIKSSTRVFRPIDIKMGPDGAIYVADWCNPIINHGEVDFRDPRRDHTHGRIWRITAKGRPLVEKPKLVGLSPSQLLEQLKSPEGYTREQAMRLLAERGASEVQPALAAWVKSLDPVDPKFEHNRLEAIWAYESVNVVEPKLLNDLLASKDARVRAAAVRIVLHWRNDLPNPLALLEPRVADENSRVRLEAVSALADIRKPEAAALALKVLALPRDKFIDYAAWNTINLLKDVWLPQFQAGKLALDGPQQAFALAAVKSKDALKPQLELYRGGELAPDAKAALIDLIVTTADVSDLGTALAIAIEPNRPAGSRVEVLSALREAARQRKATPRTDLMSLKPLLASSDPGVRSAAVRLAGSWKLQAVRPEITSIATEATTPDAVRRAAVEALAELGGPKSIETLTTLSASGQSEAVRMMAVIGLVSLDANAAATKAVELLAAAGGADPTPLIVAFLEKSRADQALATALADHKIPADTAKLGLRAVFAASRNTSPLIPALTTAGGVDSQPKELTKDDMAALIADVVKTGNPSRGEKLFRRAELSCLVCHAVGGAGGQVGPDMVSLGASAPLDYIIDSVLLPNKAVKEGFHSVIVKTKDGDEITGIKVKQTDTELVLRDMTHDAVQIPLARVKEQKDGGSIMPSGLTDSLTRPELVDLIRFLSELGKQGPYAVGSTATSVARRWRVLDPPMPDNSSINPELLDANGSLTWVPVYSQIEGVLPTESLPAAAPRATVRCQIDVSTGGSFKLRINSTDKLTMWVDNAAMKPESEMKLDLSQGVHTFTFVYPRAARQEGLKVELAEGGTGKAQFVSGK